MVLVISVRHTRSGLKHLLVPAAVAWPLNCVVFRKQMPEKKYVDKSFPSLICSPENLETVIPQDRSCSSCRETPLHHSISTKSWRLLECSQKLWSARMAGSLCWYWFVSDLGSNSLYQNSGSPANARGNTVRYIKII